MKLRLNKFQELAAGILLSKSLVPDLSHSRAHFPLTYLPEQWSGEPTIALAILILVIPFLRLKGKLWNIRIIQPPLISQKKSKLRSTGCSANHR